MLSARVTRCGLGGMGGAGRRAFFPHPSDGMGHDALEPLFCDGVVADDGAIATLCLCFVECQVCISHHVVNIVRVGAVALCHSDADRQGNILGAVAHGGGGNFRDKGRGADVNEVAVDTGHEDREFLSAQTSDVFIGKSCGAQVVSQLLEGFVARFMAVGVVHQLEVIGIHDHQDA